MNVYLYCNSDKNCVDISPRLCPFFISSGVTTIVGSKCLWMMSMVQIRPVWNIMHLTREKSIMGKLTTCSDNNQPWIWYRLVLAIFQAVSCCYSGILNGWKVHSWLILGLRTCICFSSRDVSLLPESLVHPESLLHTRPGPTQHKLQRNVVQFVCFFYVSIALVFSLFCIFASSDFLEKS